MLAVRGDLAVAGGRVAKAVRLLSRRSSSTALVGGLLAVAVVVLTATTREVYDDPWILYRYAENLAHGLGWTFNPGVHETNAVTSPLTVLLLAALVVLGAPVTTAAAVLFALGTWMTAYFTYLWLRISTGNPAGLAASILLIGAPLLLSFRGMESAIYLGLVAAAVYAFVRRAELAFGLLVGLAILARPDAVLLAMSGFVCLSWSERKLPWRAATGGLAVLVPWVPVSVALTGSLIPSTLAAKIAQADSGAWPSFFGLVPLMVLGGMVTWCLLVLPIAVLGLRELRGPVLVVVCAAAAQVFTYGVILHIAGYVWYFALPAYAVVVLAGIGTQELVELLPRRAARMSPTLMAVSLAVVVALTGVVQVPAMDPERVDYRQVGEWLRSSTPADSTVAASEIGRLGEISDRRMVDYMGLLDARAIDHLRHRDWDWWPAMYVPDYWVTFHDVDWEVEAAIRDDPSFNLQYRPVYLTRTLTVYGRQRPAQAGPK